MCSHLDPIHKITPTSRLSDLISYYVYATAELRRRGDTSVGDPSDAQLIEGYYAAALLAPGGTHNHTNSSAAGPMSSLSWCMPPLHPSIATLHFTLLLGWMLTVDSKLRPSAKLLLECVRMIILDRRAYSLFPSYFLLFYMPCVQEPTAVTHDY